VRDVARVAGAPVPRLEADPRPESVRRRVADQSRYLAEAVELVKGADLRRTLCLSTPDLAALVASLYQRLCQDPTPIHLFAETHLAEDRATMTAMGMG